MGSVFTFGENQLHCLRFYLFFDEAHFEDHKEPLFGRLTSKFVLKPFKTSVLIEILRDYNPAYTPDDLLCLYTLTGGVAKYVTLLMDAGAVTLETMIDFVTQPDSPLLTEGRDMLVQEFGRDYSTYFLSCSSLRRGIPGKER